MNRHHAAWIERLARFGYAAKGIVYATVGIIAAKAAFSSGSPEGSRDALSAIAAQPFGQLMLAIVAVGLFGYVLWRLVQAIKDPEHGNATEAKDIVRRIGYGMSGLTYASLALSATRIITTGQDSSSGGNSAQTWTAKLMSQPFGQWLVGTLGALAIGFGVYYFYRAFSNKFRKKLKFHQMPENTQKLVIGIARFGLSARGVVFILIGGFLIQAARTFDPEKVETSEGVLQQLSQRPFILFAVALGLISYGLYLGIQARYRRIPVN
ncbi:MAG: DUF1206 domain-containing protein [Geitlerinemataceae cyanobacterium]